MTYAQLFFLLAFCLLPYLIVKEACRAKLVQKQKGSGKKD